jgi:hypothetical protein
MKNYTQPPGLKTNPPITGIPRLYRANIIGAWLLNVSNKQRAKSSIVLLTGLK